MSSLFEAISFEENQLYEQIISDIVTQKYSIVEDFFTAEDIRHSARIFN